MILDKKKTIKFVGFNKWKFKFLKKWFNGKKLTITKFNADIGWGETDCVYNCEDGFIRSVGLGSSGVWPKSLVFDEIGIYYDAQNPSKLEVLLNENENFNIVDIKDLIRIYKEEKISKYNIPFENDLGESIKEKIKNNSGNIKLVLGQVSDDKSMKKSGFGMTNEKMLDLVYEKSSEKDLIIYKEHPDVSFNGRNGKIKRRKNILFISKIPTYSLLEYIEEVHTITSLSGFEFLIHDKKVFCYGIPFYSGWGLTIDYQENLQPNIYKRRNTKITKEELFYNTIIKYPTYFSYIQNKEVTAKETIMEIIEEKHSLSKKHIYYSKLIKDKIINFYKTLKSKFKIRKASA